MTDNKLFFVCSLIEKIGRERNLTRKEVVSSLGHETVKHIYDYADVLHCEPMAKVADEYIGICKVGTGNYDDVSLCKYAIPSYWDIGKVYARLIEDVAGQDSEEAKIIQILEEVYGSWMSDSLSNYNSDLYYQPRDYIRECYLEGEIL